MEHKQFRRELEKHLQRTLTNNPARASNGPAIKQSRNMTQITGNKIIAGTMFSFNRSADAHKFNLKMAAAGVPMQPINEKQTQIYEFGAMLPYWRENAVKLGAKIYKEIMRQSK